PLRKADFGSARVRLRTSGRTRIRGEDWTTWGDCAMKWFLVVERGPRKGDVIPLRRRPFLIGRASGCHLRPSAASISKRHCMLAVRDGKLFVAAYKTTNGTLVNGERIKGAQTLEAGDRLQVGPLAFVVTLGEPPSQADPDEERFGQMLLRIDAKEKTRRVRAT